jgi:hypothetical protein
MSRKYAIYNKTDSRFIESDPMWGPNQTEFDSYAEADRVADLLRKLMAAIGEEKNLEIVEC